MERTRYKLEFADQTVLDEIRKLPKNIQIMVSRAMKDRLQNDPFSYGKPLRYSLKGHRVLRVSNYIIIYKVENYNITIFKVDIRRDVYENF